MSIPSDLLPPLAKSKTLPPNPITLYHKYWDAGHKVWSQTSGKHDRFQSFVQFRFELLPGKVTLTALLRDNLAQCTKINNSIIGCCEFTQPTSNCQTINHPALTCGSQVEPTNFLIIVHLPLAIVENWEDGALRPSINISNWFGQRRKRQARRRSFCKPKFITRRQWVANKEFGIRLWLNVPMPAAACEAGYVIPAL